MTTGSIAPMLDRNYKASHSYQWAREAVVNSMQIGATRIHFTTEWQAVNALGVHRRMMIDDGPGIDPHKMPGFINKFGGSGKTIGAAQENFGIGLKTSLLTWNKYGVVVIAKNAAGEVSLMWLHKDDDTDDPHGTYGARLFDIDREDGVYGSVVPLHEYDEYEIDGVDYTKVFPADQQTGFAVILLGNDTHTDTVLGAPDRDESTKYGIIQYLNSRFWDINVDIVVDQYENWGDRTQWPTGPRGTAGSTPITQGRKPKGLRQAIETNFKPTTRFPNRALVDSGTIEIFETDTQPGIKVHWWLGTEATDEKTGKDAAQRGDIPTLPITGVLHEAHHGIAEVFDLASPGVGSTSASFAKTRMGRFVKASSVRDRLAIIIEPVESETVDVFPDQSRTKVMYSNETSGGQEMPWDYWYECWNDQTPKAVRTAITDYYDSLSSNSEDGMTDEDYRRLGSRYAQTFKRIYADFNVFGKGGPFGRRDNATKRVRKSTPPATQPDSTDPVEPLVAAEGKVPAQPSDDKAATSTTSTKPRARYSNVGLTICQTISEPGEALISYDANEARALLNTAHPRFERMMECIVERYVDDNRLSADDDSKRMLIVQEVTRTAQQHVALAVSDAVAEAAANPSEAENILSEHSLSSCLRGIRHIESMSAGSIGQALSGNKKAPKKTKAA
jgi:hypothetical protein